MAIPKVRRSTVEVEALLSSEYNPRSISNEALSALKVSIEKFGLVQEIVVNERNNKIVGGHQRVKAMRAAGVEKANVAYVDLNDHDEKALNVALNSPHLMGTFTDDLHDLMDELQIEDYPDFDDLRFDSFGGDNASHIDTYEKQRTPAEPDVLDSEEVLPQDMDEQISENHVETVGGATLMCGDCIALMGEMEDNTVDAIVTDPPYGIGFMGKDWDQSVPGDAWANECLRILKPGGHIIAFAATRTIHRLTTTLEDAGFEIRDQISWIQWQGFPKSMKIESMPGWGTALKPSQEPAILVRKPPEGTVADNVAKWGVGGLNIDGCRIAYGDAAWPGPGDKPDWKVGRTRLNVGHKLSGGEITNAPSEIGRWPANIYHCPKPARSEKEEGCEDLEGKTGYEATDRKAGSKGLDNPRAGAGRTAEHVKNYHPTVKPVNLMRWLVRLVTPRGGVVLDTFLGSGTTCIAAQREDIRSIGIEKDPEYAKIAMARIRKTKGNE